MVKVWFLFMKGLEAKANALKFEDAERYCVVDPEPHPCEAEPIGSHHESI